MNLQVTQVVFCQLSPYWCDIYHLHVFPAASEHRGFAMTDFGDVVSAPTGRFEGIERPYSAEDVLRLRGSLPIEHTLARRGALKLWELLNEGEPVRALGAVTGNQAMQMVRAGLKAIYLSGWQAAADANTAGAMYPDQSLYPANTGPELARKINRALQRADQVEHSEGGSKRDWFAPIVADAEAGFGGPAQLLRDHEGLYRGGRRRRSLRGPARFRKEVRPPRRQGADPDPGRDPQPRRGAARGGRQRRSDRPRRPHRCGERKAHHLRRRRARP